MNNYNKAVVEVLEIVKYLDDDLKKIIDKDFLKKISQDKDDSYKFILRKDVPIYDNEFLDETVILLERLFTVN